MEEGKKKKRKKDGNLSKCDRLMDTGGVCAYGSALTCPEQNLGFGCW